MELVREGDATLLRLSYDDGDARYPVRVDPLMTSWSWTSDELDATRSVAWGDWDGDGDLDLAAGNANGDPNRVYENTGGTLTTTAVWTSDDTVDTWGVAWGDWDGGGDLDLAAGNDGQVNVVYENLGGTLSTFNWTCAGTGGGTCTAGGSGDISDAVDLPVGASVTYTATATVDPESTATEISNTATVSVPAGVGELNAADNASTDTDAAHRPGRYGCARGRLSEAILPRESH